MCPSSSCPISHFLCPIPFPPPATLSIIVIVIWYIFVDRCLDSDQALPRENPVICHRDIACCSDSDYCNLKLKPTPKPPGLYLNHFANRQQRATSLNPTDLSTNTPSPRSSCYRRIKLPIQLLSICIIFNIIFVGSGFVNQINLSLYHST